jgi:hypothetical protein
VTTSFALAAHGRLVDSLVTQPLGLVLFLMTAVGLILNAAAAWAGRSWFGPVTAYRFGTVIIALVLIALASWGYKWSVM